MATVTLPFACFRDNPERPERPERDRGFGPGRWFFIAVVFLVLLVLTRLLGPVWVTLVWILGLGAFYGFQAVKAWKNRR